MKTKLINSDSESEDGEASQLQVNQDYAQAYQRWRQKEEYQKLKDKYGENVISSDSAPSDDSEDDSSESEEESLNDAAFDKEFLKVYGALKKKDPTIYDKELKFFPESDLQNLNNHCEKPGLDQDFESPKNEMSLRDYHRMLVEKHQGVTEEDKEFENLEQPPNSYVKELENIKKEFKSLVDDDDGDDNGELLKSVKQNVIPRTASTVDSILNSADDEHIGFLREFWEKHDLDEKEKFLKEYILNQKYIESDIPVSNGATKRSLITSEDISSSSSKKTHETKELVVDSAKEDAQSKSILEEFSLKVPEHHYEDEDAQIIKRFPRNLESIRDLKEGQLKAQKRNELKARKKKEKEETLQRFRQLKRAEISNKLQKLADISGNKKLKNREIDIDLLVDDLTDFDPEKYDEKMKSLFSDDYYQDSESHKPKFEFVPGIDDVEDNLEPGKSDDDSKVKQKKRKLDKQHEKKDPLKKKTIGIYEDIVGDQPTRFKYRQVPPNDFGLSAEELLFADDKELNKWASLKKTCQYRNLEEEKYDQKTYSRKKDNTFLKKKVFKSLYDDTNDSQENVTKGPVNSNKSIGKFSSRSDASRRNNKTEKKMGTKVAPHTNVIERLKTYNISNRAIKRLSRKKLNTNLKLKKGSELGESAIVDRTIVKKHKKRSRKKKNEISS